MGIFLLVLLRPSYHTYAFSTPIRRGCVCISCAAEALEFAEEQELSLEMMGRVRRALRRIEDAGGAGVMEGALSTMTEEDIEKFRMERDERHAKAANPR